MSNERNKPATPVMWWDGGERAITPREKALIEEHGPSSFSIALVLATGQLNYTPPQMAASFRAGQNTERMQADGYRDAFFELGAMLGLSAQPRSPKEVWEDQMRPALKRLIAIGYPNHFRAVLHAATPEDEVSACKALAKAVNDDFDSAMGVSL